MIYITENQKAEAEGALDISFNIFKRNLLVFKTPEKVYIGTNENYNPTYGRHAVEPSYIVNSGTIEATMKFGPSDAQIIGNTFNDSAIVKIKVKKSDKGWVENAEKFVIDDINYQKDTEMGGPVPRGLFDVKYYNVTLKRNG